MENLKFSNIGELYVGWLLGKLTTKEVIKFCESTEGICNEEELTEIRLAAHESKYELEKYLIFLINKYKLEEILTNSDSIPVGQPCQIIDVIPECYLLIWKLIDISEIVNSQKKDEDKIWDLYYLGMRYCSPKEWTEFSPFSAPKNGVPIGVNELYKNFVNYYEKIKVEYSTNKKAFFKKK